MNKIAGLMQMTREPVVRVFDGYGDAHAAIVQGYVLGLSPLPRKNYRQNFLVNLYSLIRLFIIQPIKNARVILEWNGESHEQVSDRHGYFKFEWKPLNPVQPGWQKARVSYVTPAPGSVAIAHGECEIFIPHVYQYNFISDIDDTFLVSHSSRLFKRLGLLFTKNPRSRKAFEGVVQHYRMLANASAPDGIPNPFFYVSSSEWNLYSYISEFCRQQDMPRGVLLLSSMKSLHQVFTSGQGRHATKYVRIARILKSYPDHQYVLLGDNSQQDPEIYHAISRDFSNRIFAVYIRLVSKRKTAATEALLQKIEEMGIHVCLFRYSSEAMAHSRKIRLIDL